MTALKPHDEAVTYRGGHLQIIACAGAGKTAETGGSYTVKEYSSQKTSGGEGGWQHERITLSPLNPDFQPIVLDPEGEDDVRVVAEFVSVLRPHQ